MVAGGLRLVEREGGEEENSGNPGVGCARKRVSGGDRRSRAHPVPGALRVGEKFNPPG